MVKLRSTTFAYTSLAASVAVAAAAIVAVPSWAEAPQGRGAAAQPAQLAQAEEAAEAEADDGEEEEPVPEFTEEMLDDPELIALGEEVWQSQCGSCHGRAAYPGKAPRLRPGRYDPEFVYHRVTYGFRGMPAWEDVFSEEERIGVTAYVLSREFSP